MSRLRHFDNLNTARFITFSCFHRYQLLTNKTAISIFLSVLDELRLKSNVKLFGYVVMPEHVHLVLHPPDGLKIGLWVGELKSRSARMIFSTGYSTAKELRTGKGSKYQRVFWQPRCYDHNCRSELTVREKIEYCHKNPVTRKLVAAQEDWMWSSSAWYEGRNDVPINIDEFH